MTFKPGAVRPDPPTYTKPKWANGGIVQKGPAKPEVVPAEGFKHVAPGVVMKIPERLPNKRGGGGRPSTAQETQSGKDKAEKLLDEVREKTPKTFQVPPRKNWARQIQSEEEALEQREAEAVLAARSDRLTAIEEETILIKANRKLALRFSAAGLDMLEVMREATGALKARLKNPKEVSTRELLGTIQTAGKTISMAQRSVEGMARAERWILRHPLETGEEGQEDDLAGLDGEGAKRILANLSKQLSHTAKQLRGNPIVGTVPGEVVPPAGTDE